MALNDLVSAWRWSITMNVFVLVLIIDGLEWSADFPLFFQPNSFWVLAFFLFAPSAILTCYNWIVIYWALTEDNIYCRRIFHKDSLGRLAIIHISSYIGQLIMLTIFLAIPDVANKYFVGWVRTMNKSLIYRADGVNGPQEMERKLATAKHVAWPSCAWQLLSFFPFPVGHSPHPPCRSSKRSLHWSWSFLI